ncbi:MAG: hypothetical protein U0871_18580 [Gemmataceae bacterium]
MRLIGLALVVIGGLLLGYRGGRRRPGTRAGGRPPAAGMCPRRY